MVSRKVSEMTTAYPIAAGDSRSGPANHGPLIPGRLKTVKRRVGVGRKAVENFLQAGTPARNDPLLGSENIVRLQQVGSGISAVGELVKTLAVVEQVLPVPDHAKGADLGIDPVAFLERVVVTGDTGNQALAVQRNAGRKFRATKFDKGRVQVGKVDEVSGCQPRLGN